MDPERMALHPPCQAVLFLHQGGHHQPSTNGVHSNTNIPKRQTSPIAKPYRHMQVMILCQQTLHKLVPQLYDNSKHSKQIHARKY